MSSQLVVDVSHHNKTVDWETFAKTGAHAIIRCGYGDDVASQDDKQWERNISEVERLGIPHGVYFYSHATTQEQIYSEIRHAKRLLEGHELQYPVYFDSEEPGTEEFAAHAARTFCAAMEGLGYWAGVYASDSWFRENLQGVDDYTKWVARYSEYPPRIDCDMWQFTSKGTFDSVPAANGGVDLSYCYRDFPAEIAGWELQKEVMEMGPWFAFAYEGATFVYMDGKAVCMPCAEDWERMQEVYREQSDGKEIPKAAISEALCKLLIGVE